jgi:iron complex outermembrane receptor protein
MAVARGLLAAALGGALSAVPLVAQAQTGTVTGRVVDSTSQQPLANVTVRIEGTQLGALSRPDGSFTIGGVPTGARSVRAARVGFAARSATVNVTAGGSATVTFNLTPLATQLTEVVAVAYSAGTQDRRNVTGSVAAVDSTLFNKGRVVSAEDLIQAKVAGVQVVSSNEPGGGISVRVRGQASVNGNTDPLFVIDGIPLPIGGGLSGGRNPLNFLNPQDIANVTVLKDAQATAIYGSRGANGVVLITTKNGSRNAPQVTYGVNYSNRTVANAPTLLNSDQFRQVVTQYGPAANVALLQNNNTNWFDALKQTGGGQEHNLAFSGVRQDLQYRLSLGFLGDEGVLRGDNTNRISAQFNYADKLFNNVLDVQSTLRGVRTRDVFSGGRFLGEILGSAPTNPIRNPDGSFFATTNQLAPRNPLALIAAQRSNGQTDRAIGNLQTRANLPFLPGLSATVRGSFDAARTRQTEFTPRSDPSQAFVADTSRGRYYQNLPDATTLVLDAFGNYTRRVNAIGADLDVTGGYSYETSTGNNASFTALGLGSDALGTSGIPAANRVLTPPVNIQERRLASFFGRANATIAERYLFGVSVRRDGSSRFGTNNQWGTFPAVSVGWRAYEESFLRGKLPGLSDLKFRYSYGINGNEPPGNYLAYSTYSYSIPQSQVQFGNVFIPTLAPSTANPNLRWEESRTHNIGLDYGLFSNRITGTLDYYNKLTNDLLFNAAVPGGSNFNNRLLQNVGSLRNAGFEVGINASVLEGRGQAGFSRVRYDANFNASTNRNRLLQLSTTTGAVSEILNGQIGLGGDFVQTLRPGLPLNAFRVLRVRRDASGNPVTGPQTTRNTTYYVDQNGDNEITDADLVAYKSPQPRWILGHTSNLAYGNFDLNFTLRSYLGHYVYNRVAAEATFSQVQQGGVLRNLNSQVFRYNFLNPQFNSELLVERADFLRMDNITVGYSLPNYRALRSTRVFATVQNAFTTSRYGGIDPLAGGLGGIDNNTYPLQRIFTLGLNVGF